MSGQNAEYALQYGASQINAGGGIDIKGTNYTVDVVPVDVTSDVSSAPSLIATALSQYNFSGVILNADFAYQLNQIFDTYKMPMINNGIIPTEDKYNYSWETSTNLFGLLPDDISFMQYLNNISPVTNIGVICDTTGFGEAQCPTWNSTAYALHESPVLYTFVNTPMSPADVGPIVTKVLDSKVNYLFVAIFDVGSIELLTEALRADGYTGAIVGMGPGWSGGAVHDAIGSAINGAFVGDCWLPDLTPALTSYITSKTGVTPLGASGCAYGELYELVDAIIAAGSAKTAAVEQELGVIRITSGPAWQTFGGFGWVGFNTTNHRGADTAYWGQWINQTFHTIFPAAFAKAQVVWPYTYTSTTAPVPVALSLLPQSLTGICLLGTAVTVSNRRNKPDIS